MHKSKPVSFLIVGCVKVSKSQNSSGVVATKLREIVRSDSFVSYYLLITEGKFSTDG